MSLPVLAIGLPSSSALGNRMLLKFAKSTDENDIEWRVIFIIMQEVDPKVNCIF